MGRSSASAGDGSETLSDKDFPGSVFSHGVFVIRNGAFFSSALPQLEIGCAAPSVFLMAWSDPSEAEHSSRAQSHRRAVAWPDSETFFRFRTKLLCELASTASN